MTRDNIVAHRWSLREAKYSVLGCDNIALIILLNFKHNVGVVRMAFQNGTYLFCENITVLLSQHTPMDDCQLNFHCIVFGLVEHSDS